jgi:hypothetical protein
MKSDRKAAFIPPPSIPPHKGEGVVNVELHPYAIVLGFRAAGAHFVGSLGRCPTSTFATLRVDRLAVRETELFPDKNIMV